MAATYENRRFGYAVDVPESFEALPESANGDGRVFVYRFDDRASVTFYARNQLGEDDTLGREGASRIPPDVFDADASESGPMYYASFKQGDVYVDALVFLTGGVFYSGTARWPIAEDAKFKPLFHDVFASWKIHGNPTVY
jgi:hypothetical protein